MGLSASQARFLQLTARRSDIEYEVQQINFQRLQLSNKLSAASTKYQDATTNRKMVFSFNTGSEVQKVDLSYTNYKNYMNQQLEGLSTSQEKYYLVSSSGNKLVVGSEEEKADLIERNTTRTSMDSITAAKAEVSAYEEYERKKANNELGEDYTIVNKPSSEVYRLAQMDVSQYERQVITNDEGEEIEYVLERKFTDKDFMIVEDLDDTELFQKAIQDGVYYFAQYEENDEGEKELARKGWETLGGGAIVEEYDKSDDAQAEAEYQQIQDKVQSLDKKLELKLDQLETERNAITTELESVQKVVEDNIESSFNTFS